MQIDVDFEVFKSLTALRRDEVDSENDVIRRLLRLADSIASDEDARDKVTPARKSLVLNALLGATHAKDGAWIGNVFFPNGTRFRATYKGQTFHAEIKNDVWVGEDNVVRQSPSEAAGAISGTNVNGWRFWYGLRPQDDDWSRLDEFRK